MTTRHVSAHDVTCRSFNLQCHQQTPAASAPPLFRGMWASINRELEVEKREGGPMKWEAQAVCRENGQRQMSLPVFSRSFFLHWPLTPVTPRLPPPPPSRPNASRRWFFSSFRHNSHHHHLPRIPTRAGGGHFHSSNPPPTTTTSLASKREPEVVFFVLSTRLLPPPPSHPNASRRWFLLFFRPVSHRHHLPRVQTRAGGGSFNCFDRPPPLPPPLRPNASWRWFLRLFRLPATTPPPSRSNASWR